MKYFCSQCQKKYDIGDIAADLYDICNEEITDGVKKLLSYEDDETLVLCMRLVRFVSDKTASAEYLTVKGSEIEKHVINPVWDKLTLRGRFTLTLGWLLDQFIASGVNEDYEAMEGTDCKDPGQIDAELRERFIFDKEMVFYFGEIGTTGEKVLDHITDSNNDPFSFVVSDEKTEIRGYRRICPHCGKRIARAVGRAPEVVVWLAGSGRAGKTSALIAIASALSSGKYANYGLSMQPLSFDEQWSEIEEQIKLYDKGIRVIKTDTTQEGAPSQSFLIKIGDSHRTTKRVLTFVDMPGEFFASPQSGDGLNKEFFTQYSKMMENIDFIWLFISKLVAYGYDIGETDAERNETQKRLVDETSDSYQIIKMSTAAHLNENLFAIQDFLKAKGLKMPPLVMMLTKAEVDIDDISMIKKYSLFPIADNEIAKDVNNINANEIKKTFVADKSGRYRINELELFNKAVKVRNFFSEVNSGITDAIETNCKYRFYISMAAYGHPAASIGEDGYEPTPYHEMMPLLWTMAMSGAIPIDHLCSWSKKNMFGAFGKPVKGSKPVIFNSMAYTKGIRPKTNPNEDKQVAQDNLEIEKDVASNLLFENIVQNKLNYKETIFLHEQR